jgi:hypothetical protein
VAIVPVSEGAPNFAAATTRTPGPAELIEW